MSKKRPYLKPVLLLLILVVIPLTFYYLLVSKGENRYKSLIIYGPREIAENGQDTVYHTIQNFELTDQTGKPFRYPEDVKNKIVIVNFFFGHCPDICPAMNANLAKVVEAFKTNEYVHFLSLSVDPQRDTPEYLREYIKNESFDYPSWQFLTGDKPLIYSLARKGFFLNADKGDGGPNDFLHSSQIVLLDPHGRLRGYYDGLNYKDIEKLINETKVLLIEEVREKRKIQVLN